MLCQSYSAKNNLEIVMVKAGFALLTASSASEEILICEKPKRISEIPGGFHVLPCHVLVGARHKLF